MLWEGVRCYLDSNTYVDCLPLPLPLYFSPAGDLIHLVNTVSQESKPQELLADAHNLLLAPKAYNLSSNLMRILMKSRVLNEEPLELVGGEIKATGKRSDPFNLLCYENTPNCQFSIPQAFNTTLSNLTDVIQVMFQVDSNPFPFGYISNYTVSTKVASMEFQTHNGVQIPIGSLDSEKAITVMVSNNTDAHNLSAGTEVIEARTSVNLIVVMESNNREAGLHFQLTYRVLNGRADRSTSLCSLLFSWERRAGCCSQERTAVGDVRCSQQVPHCVAEVLAITGIIQSLV